MLKDDGGVQRVVVLIIKEIKYVVVGPFDDLVGPLSYLYL